VVARPAPLTAGVRRMDNKMNLDSVEADLLGDLAQDDHSLYEVFEFVRGHRPTASDPEVVAEGRRVLESWLERGWLRLAGEGAMWGAVKSTAELLPLVDSLGTGVTRYFVGSPWLRLTEKAHVDVPWLVERRSTTRRRR